MILQYGENWLGVRSILLKHTIFSILWKPKNATKYEHSIFPCYAFIKNKS